VCPSAALPYPRAALVAAAFQLFNPFNLAPATLALCLPVVCYLVFSYLDGSEFREGKPWPWLARWTAMHAIIGRAGAGTSLPGVSRLVTYHPRCHRLNVFWLSLPGVSDAQMLTWILAVIVNRCFDDCKMTLSEKWWCRPTLRVGERGYLKPAIIYDDEAALKEVERAGPAQEQCIFGCFPHGVVSFHHGILMTDTAGRAGTSHNAILQQSKQLI
jgi:hypothetical protein